MGGTGRVEKCALIMETTAVTGLQDAVKVAAVVVVHI